MADMSMRGLAYGTLNLVRRAPLVHRPVHALALKLTGTRAGRRFIAWVQNTPLADWGEYADWVAAYDTLDAADRAAIRAHIGCLARLPLISVVMPVYNTPEAWLVQAIESVRGQLYEHWELCVADDASPDPGVWRVLSEYAARDPRIRVVRREVNGHISAATNTALEMARGEYVALLDHDDILSERALYEVAVVLNDHPDAALIYSDEDKLDERGRRWGPYFKPDFDPELLLQQNLISHLGVYRREVLQALGGLRQGFEGSQDHDLALRVVEAVGASRVRHIPSVLYHWRQEQSESSFSERQIELCQAASLKAVQEHLARTGQAASAEPREGRAGWVRVRRPLPDPVPLVTVVVPTRDRADLLEQAVGGVLHRTDYPALEVLIVDNGSVEPRTLALFEELQRDPRVRVLHDPSAFNYAKLNNAAARAARGEVLLLLNNDVCVMEPSWLAEMATQAVRPKVGAVGARLLFPDGRLQHAGVVLGGGEGRPVAWHYGSGMRGGDPGPDGQFQLVRNVSAATAACLALRREVFEEVGGFDEELAVAFNDVDLCLKIRAAGYDIVWTPFAELTHQESASRGQDVAGEARARHDAEVERLRARWGPKLNADPFFSPNLDRTHGDGRLAFPPAGRKSWAV